MGKEGGVRGNEGMEKREIGETEGPSFQILLGSQKCPWNECVTVRLLRRNQKPRGSHALGGKDTSDRKFWAGPYLPEHRVVPRTTGIQTPLQTPASEN